MAVDSVLGFLNIPVIFTLNIVLTISHNKFPLLISFYKSSNVLHSLVIASFLSTPIDIIQFTIDVSNILSSYLS